MKKIYLLAFFPLLLTSCAPSIVRYVGSQQSPTRKVDVFVDASSIKREYEIIGKGYTEPNWRGQVNQEEMLRSAIEKARKNGADAIFFKEVFVPTPGTNISTHSRTDSAGKSLVLNTNTEITPVYGYFHKEMLFLKYK